MTPAVTRIVRVGTWTIVCALAILGLITAGFAVLLPGLVATMVGGVVASSLARQRGAASSKTWIAGLGWGVGAGVGVLAVAGLVVVIGPGMIPAAAALGVPLVWAHRRPLKSVAAQEAEDDAAPLRRLSNLQLARAWQTSYGRLAVAPDAAALDRLCALRKQQLDEIERRDPTGFHRWISSGYWVRGDSAPFLG
jgi:hypothetical protein